MANLSLPNLSNQILEVQEATKNLEKQLSLYDEDLVELSKPSWQYKVTLQLQEVRKDVVKMEARDSVLTKENKGLHAEVDKLKSKIAHLSSQIRAKQPSFIKDEKQDPGLAIDDHVREAAYAVKSEIEAQARTHSQPVFIEFSPVKSAKQLQKADNGMKYCIKIRTNANTFLHACVFRGPEKDAKHVLKGVQFGRTLLDLCDFECERDPHSKIECCHEDKKEKVCGAAVDAEVDESVVLALKAVEAELRKQASENNVKVESLTPVQVMKQCVAGTNYFVKVCLEQDKFCFVRIYGKLDGTHELTSVEWNKGQEDKIEYF